MLGIYFSGTGNTKYCVENFIKRISNSVEILSLEDNRVIEAIKSEDSIVLGYPVYFSNIPKIVRDFIETNKNLFKGKNIFIISTMALFSGDGAGCAGRLLKKYGANIIGGLHLKMPDSIGDERLLKRSQKNNIELVKKTIVKIEVVAEKFKNGEVPQEGLGTFSYIIGLLGQRLWFYNKTRVYTDKVKINKEKCIKCELCIKLCPMNNLELHNGEVYSKGKCTMCYRCFSSCPKEAITILGQKVYEQCRIDKYI